MFQGTTPEQGWQENWEGRRMSAQVMIFRAQQEKEGCEAQHGGGKSGAGRNNLEVEVVQEAIDPHPRYPEGHERLFFPIPRSQ